MTATATRPAILARETPFWLPIRQREARERSHVGLVNALEAFERCPECRAAADKRQARLQASLDLHRDAALTRRDINEAMETLTLEILEDADV